MHQEFELCGTRESSSKHRRLVTLGCCCSLDGLEKVISWSPSKKLWRSPEIGCERSSAHLAGVVKSNSNGIEVWRGSLIQAGSKIKRSPDIRAVDSLNPPQRGLEVTGKSSTPRKKSYLVPGYFFASCHPRLQTSLVIEFARDRISLVLLIKFL